MQVGVRLLLAVAMVSVCLTGCDCGGDDDTTTSGGGGASGVTGATGATGSSGAETGTISIPPEPETSRTLGDLLAEEEASRRAREERVLADAGDLGPLLNEFWEGELAASGIAFDPPDRYEYYHGEGFTACGGQATPRAHNAFYCEADGEEQVTFDLEWFQQFLEQSPGDATTFLILAHEWGHAVQDAWLENGGTDVWNPPYTKELNADCLAGVFLAESIRAGTIVEEAGDTDAMFDLLYEIGSDPWLGPGDHGTREERQTAFQGGAARGTEYCRATY